MTKFPKNKTQVQIESGSLFSMKQTDDFKSNVYEHFKLSKLKRTQLTMFLSPSSY